MADNLREVIAKRLKNSQQSQTSTPTPSKVEVPQETDELDEEFDDDELDEEFDDDEEVPAKVEETPVKAKKVAPKVADAVSDEEKAQAEMQENAQRIMMLQDNGIFRAELLHQLNEIKRALTILASLGIELANPNGKK